MAQQHKAQRNTEHHAQRINELLAEAQRECRANSKQTNDPSAHALFTMLAEILGGAMKALQDYQSREYGWQKGQRPAEDQEKQLAIDIDQIEPSSKASATVPYD